MRSTRTTFGCCGSRFGAALPSGTPAAAAHGSRYGGVRLNAPAGATVTWHQGAALRSAPSTRAPVIGMKRAGDQVRVLVTEVPALDGQGGEWWRVTDAFGRKGFVRAFHGGTRDVTMNHASPPPAIIYRVVQPSRFSRGRAIPPRIHR